MKAMTYSEIAEMIDSIGIPSAYYEFTEDTAVSPPFICFYYSRNNDFKADNQNYVKIEQLTIELYTDEKDFEREASVEAVLKNYELAYSRSETYIGSERMYMVVYNTEVIINA